MNEFPIEHCIEKLDTMAKEVTDMVILVDKIKEMESHFELMLNTLKNYYRKEVMGDPRLKDLDLDEEVFNTLFDVMGKYSFDSWMKQERSEIAKILEEQNVIRAGKED